jgi:hypothetical protein
MRYTVARLRSARVPAVSGSPLGPSHEPLSRRGDQHTTGLLWNVPSLRQAKERRTSPASHATWSRTPPPRCRASVHCAA